MYLAYGNRSKFLNLWYCLLKDDLLFLEIRKGRYNEVNTNIIGVLTCKSLNLKQHGIKR